MKDPKQYNEEDLAQAELDLIADNDAGQFRNQEEADAAEKEYMEMWAESGLDGKDLHDEGPGCYYRNTKL